MTRQFAKYRLLAMVVAASALTAPAQAVGQANPAASLVPAPQANFQSAFAGYKTFEEQKMLPWKETLDGLASVPGAGGHADHGGKGMAGMTGMDHKGAMADMPGMAGMDHKGGKPDMPAMAGMDHKGGKSDMPGMAGMDHKSRKSDMPGMAGMDHKGGKPAMPAMPGMQENGKKRKSAEPAANASAHEGHATVAMAKTQASAPATKPMQMPAGPVSGTGVIWEIDKTNGKVKMTHEPIDALGWPRMTMIFRLKDGTLPGQVKEGDKVEFSLEKSSSGYVISSFQKPIDGKNR